ncbi:MAG: hypothetical protein RLZZ573_555 [Pseudomonadota bacterium]
MALLKSKVASTPSLTAALTSICNQRKVTHWLYERSAIILKTLSGLSAAEVARELDTTVGKVRAWRRVWRSKQDWLVAIACEPGCSEARLHEALLKVFEDVPRAGRSPKFSQEQRLQIVALACGSPADYGLPETVWTHAALARQAGRLGIVDAISASQVWRILKKYGAASSSKQVLDAPADR